MLRLIGLDASKDFATLNRPEISYKELLRCYLLKASGLSIDPSVLQSQIQGHSGHVTTLYTHFHMYLVAVSTQCAETSAR